MSYNIIYFHSMDLYRITKAITKCTCTKFPFVYVVEELLHSCRIYLGKVFVIKVPHIQFTFNIVCHTGQGKVARLCHEGYREVVI